ncbi:hypothetical protein SASPL_148620 [Salvia splendens]|uniref:Uncharacterized protein n=1 Tax=Salvia splendens TaxID=180675 RepID=A0A8X8WA61_SALSN|nr:hypothetical protein SASPL_148620 [Salvia splendens]
MTIIVRIFEFEELRIEQFKILSALDLPDGFGDDLIIEVQDSKGKYCGHTLVHVDDIADESLLYRPHGEKHRHCIISRETEHEKAGKIQVYINYPTYADQNSYKGTSIVETIAYDSVLETAMKGQQIEQRNLLRHGSWKWLMDEFAFFLAFQMHTQSSGIINVHCWLPGMAIYGSIIIKRIFALRSFRYLSYVMDVATPKADCLAWVCDILLPVVIKGKSKHTFSHVEFRRLGEVSDQIEQFTLVIENSK